MKSDYLDIYAFNDKEKEILKSNENIITGKIKLSSKDIQVYFNLKANKEEIGLTCLVKKCLLEHGYNINAKEMYKPRKKPNSNEFYKANSFAGCDEYRVDTFARSFNKLIKVGLITKRKVELGNVFKTVVKD
ncbi:hypothetical protein FDB50_15150 [Clostridium botulinum]|uniref:Uncharacterized protein n=1 Tax=Clostridium botulinum TaxID=1491 RepID=A0A846JTN9_CLOBO|nr:hypothetical protein [Clostridium botulinum]NFN06040.1 hypothetical protein [Clostridium botulinum]NFN36376.1 hypothetical protein [Clostridium botulinum]